MNTLRSYVIVFVLSMCVKVCTSHLRTRSFPFRISPRHMLIEPQANFGEPLVLTSLLKAGKINEARERSEVPQLLPNVFGNAGFLTVNEEHKAHLFFWFIRSTGSNWKSAPVILWLQGGPGCSSLFGLFTETGPFVVTKEGLKRRKYAWTSRYNVLYIDQPVGSGFSFTESDAGYISSQKEVAEHLYAALTQFFLLYPELKDNGFYISGESYAGKYVPSIAYKIHESISIRNCSISLKGLFIASPFSDPITNTNYGEFTHAIGIIDYKTKKEVQQLEEETRIYIRNSLWKNATQKWSDFFDLIMNSAQFSMPYDYTREHFPSDDLYGHFIQTEKIRKSIHVGNRTYYDCSDRVWYDFENDFMQSVKPEIETLLEHYAIVFYGGQLDIITAYPMVENLMQKLQWSGAEEYRNAEEKLWYDVGNRVAGYYKEARNLKLVLVRNAGHMTPGDQPRLVLKLLDTLVNKKL